LTCFEAIVRQAPDQVCDDQRAALDAYQACACEDACADACGATACGGQMPDDGCRACLDTSCAAESEACVGGGCARAPPRWNAAGSPASGPAIASSPPPVASSRAAELA